MLKQYVMITSFWDVMPCSFVDGYQHFGVTCLSIFRVEESNILKRCYLMYQITRRNRGTTYSKYNA
jgi:hypothetical protein